MSTQSPAPPPVIAFIGGGNMARSLIGGLVARGTDPARIRVANPGADKREALIRDFGVTVFARAQEAVDGAGIWVFAVKPQVIRSVCRELDDIAGREDPLVISVAAGITCFQMTTWLGGDTAIVRGMPNTPALLGAGVTGLHANRWVSSAQRDLAGELLSSVGKVAWIDDEDLMDAVTAVSGSGPAYAFLLAEAMETAARAEGLPADAARTLVVQTLLGAARMLAESGEPAGELRRRVTSPGGTTQAAIESFQSGGFETLVADAIHAARLRGAQLSAAND